MTDTAKPEPGFLFHYTADLGDGTRLDISGNWPKGASKELMMEQTDTIKAVFSRLRAQHEIPLIQERIDGTKAQLEQKEADYAAYMEGRHSKATDKAMVARLQLEITTLKIAITKGEITLAETIERAK